jgi:MoaA/NifB/PqqE/SkfB family radical SAM enzyme
MRSERIVTNLSCNQGCTYCSFRAPSDDPRKIAPPVVRRRIDDALRAGAREIVLTGGEPTMRRDLAALVEHARKSGAERVTLETNATLLDAARARALVDAGVELFRVNLAGFDDALDGVTRDEGGFQRTLSGLRALAGVGATFEIAAAVVRSTLAWLPALPAALASAFTMGGEPPNSPPRAPVRAAPRTFGERRPAIVLITPADGPEPSELVAYDEAADVIASVDQAARPLGVRVRLAPDHRPPPCSFAQPGRVAHAFGLSAGGAARSDRVRVPACASCAVADRCDGFPSAYLARRTPPARLRPITEDRMRRRLSLAVPVEEQIARELVAKSTRREPGGKVVRDHVVRVNFHCNQACEFCFVSTHLPPATGDAVRAAIAAAAREGARVTLSGGEPTLNPELADYVRLAKSLTKTPVEIQTNAVLLDDPARARALADAGLDEAFVSLHAATAATSNAITEAPGTFERTVVGIDNLVAVGVRVTLNFVMCQLNYAELVPYVRMIAARWPCAHATISFVAPSSDVVPHTQKVIPRYSDVLPHLVAATEEAARLRVVVDGFQSMCGLPLCLVPHGPERLHAIAHLADEDHSEFVKPEPCRACALEPRCYGLRRGYAELYGTSELQPVSATPG